MPPTTPIKAPKELGARAGRLSKAAQRHIKRTPLEKSIALISDLRSEFESSLTDKSCTVMDGGRGNYIAFQSEVGSKVRADEGGRLFVQHGRTRSVIVHHCSVDNGLFHFSVSFITSLNSLMRRILCTGFGIRFLMASLI